MKDFWEIVTTILCILLIAAVFFPEATGRFAHMSINSIQAGWNQVR